MSAATWWRPTASDRFRGCWPNTAWPIGPASWRPLPPVSPGRPSGRPAPPEAWVAGSLGPGTKIASLGQISFVDQRDGYQEAAAGLLEGGVDLFVIETIQDLLQAKAAIIGCRRAMAEAGRKIPLQVQVTIETTGRMLLGTEIGAALTTLAALRPDVVGLNCATGPAEMSEHLRYLSQRSPLADLGATQRRPALRRRGPHALRPDPGAAGPTPRPLRRRVRRQRGRGMLWHHPGASPRRRGGLPAPHARRPPPGVGAGRGVHLQPRSLRPDAIRAGRRRTDQRQRVQKVPGGDAGRRLGHLPRHGPGGHQERLARPGCVRRLHRGGRRRRHAGGGPPLRHPGHPADHARFHRAAGDRDRSAADRRQAHPQLRQSRGWRRPGHPPGPVPVDGPGVRGRGGVHLHRH